MPVLRTLSTRRPRRHALVCAPSLVTGTIFFLTLYDMLSLTILYRRPIPGRFQSIENEPKKIVRSLFTYSPSLPSTLAAEDLRGPSEDSLMRSRSQMGRRGVNGTGESAWTSQIARLLCLAMTSSGTQNIPFFTCSRHGSCGDVHVSVSCVL